MRKSTKLWGVLVGTALVAGPAAAFHQWGDYHWAFTSSNKVLRVERQISSKWTSAVGGAVSDWHASVLDMSYASANANVSARRCNPIAGKVLVCNYSYGQRGWLGIASIWADGNSHITQATTKLNDSYHDKAPYNTEAWRNLVACQEIGHDFGLGHQDEDFSNANLNTCMDYTNNPASNQHPNAHDYDELRDMYAHTDSYSTASQAAMPTNFGIRPVGRPPAEPGASADNPADWGRAIGRDGQGRANRFVKELKNGGKRITHVFWVPGFRPTAADHHD